jgi:CDP-diacylglycerol--glycerol-3-phosphate 3-phosphatidyltransferase/cardiolipin synthase
VTLANQITLIRILLIPVFVGFVVYYAHGLEAGMGDERLRYAAIVTFTIAALSDALDGWIARRFNQHSKLGVILDPLADKLLLVSAICTLSFGDWPVKLPLWFVILYLTREVFSVIGAFVIHFTVGKVNIRAHWTGKVATFSEIAVVGVAILRLPTLVLPVTIFSALFIFTSGMIYIGEAIRQIKVSGHGKSAT